MDEASYYFNDRIYVRSDNEHISYKRGTIQVINRFSHRIVHTWDIRKIRVAIQAGSGLAEFGNLIFTSAYREYQFRAGSAVVMFDLDSNICACEDATTAQKTFRLSVLPIRLHISKRQLIVQTPPEGSVARQI